MTTIDADRVRPLVKASLDALDALPPRALQMSASSGFGRSYNRLRKLAARSSPDVPRGLWPPAADPEARYVEIRAYLAQLVALLG